MKRILWIFLFLTACHADDFGNRKVTEIAVNKESPTWNSGVADVLLYKCDSCHATLAGQFAPGNVKNDKFDFSASEEVFLANYAERVRRRVFNSPENPMPPKFGTPLTENELQALKGYLDWRVPLRNYP